MNGPYNVVTSTNPSGGTKVAKGSTVTLNYNVRPGAQTLPDVSGLSVSDATAKLSKAGWKNVITSATPVASLKFKNGDVVSTNPPAGKTIPLNTQIVLNVSGGGVAVPASGRAVAGRCPGQAEPGGPDLPDHHRFRAAGNDARHGLEVLAEPRQAGASERLGDDLRGAGHDDVAEPVDLAEYQPEYESEPVTE